MSSPGREPTVPDNEILEVFRETSDPVLSTREVADAIGLGRRGTYDRLRDLADDGSLQSKKLDEKRTVWWYPNALRERYADSV